jgi:hypothetical protein
MASPRERPKCQVTTHFFPSLPVTNRHSRAPDFLSFNIALFTGPLFHSSSRSPQNPSPPNTNNSYKVIFNLVYLQVYEFSTATNSLIILLLHPLIGVSAFTHTFHPTVCVPSPLDPLHWARNPRQPNASQAQGRISHFEFRNIGLFLIYGYRPNGQPINSLRNNLIPGQMSPLISYASLSRNPHPRAARLSFVYENSRSALVYLGRKIEGCQQSQRLNFVREGENIHGSLKIRLPRYLRSFHPSHSRPGGLGHAKRSLEIL